MTKLSLLWIPRDGILRLIILVRGQKVILDSDLAQLYGVTTGVLVQAVTRNLARFPADFMFQLSEDEFRNLKSQIVISSSHGGRRSRPYAFTEQGVAMLSSVLRSPRAIAVNIEIMRTFVRLRQMVAEHDDLSLRLDELENRYDGQFTVIFDAIRSLISDHPIGSPFECASSKGSPTDTHLVRECEICVPLSVWVGR